jgi:tetratricopeptide (TPR) repeat protein
MESPQQVTQRRVAALLLASAITLAASGGEDFFRGYLEKHPGAAEDELIEVRTGDPADRALAVIHHPDLGLDPLAVDLFRIDGASTVELDLRETLAESAPAGDLFIAVRQRCRGGFPGPGEPAFGSWLYLPAGRLSAWSLQPFGVGCRPEDPLVEASDHAVMRRVGQAVFRPLRRGNFRYGPLAYQKWDDAFVAPTPGTMISLLKTSVADRPGDAHDHNRLAVGLFAVGERDAAVEALRRAAELEPGWSLPHRNLAIAYLHRGDLAAAARAQERADEIDQIAVGGDSQGEEVLPDTTTSRR